MAAAPVPFLAEDLGDELFILICAELPVRDLGRLACVASRFSVRSIADPSHKTTGGAPEMWSLMQEAARRRLQQEARRARLRD